MKNKFQKRVSFSMPIHFEHLNSRTYMVISWSRMMDDIPRKSDILEELPLEYNKLCPSILEIRWNNKGHSIAICGLDKKNSFSMSILYESESELLRSNGYSITFEHEDKKISKQHFLNLLQKAQEEYIEIRKFDIQMKEDSVKNNTGFFGLFR